MKEKKTKKVLIVAGMQSWPPNVGGSPTVMYNLFKGLEHENFDVLTCSREHAKKDNRKLKNKVYNFSTSTSVSLKLIWRLHFIEDIIRYVIAGYELLKKKDIYDSLLITFPDSGSIISGYILSKMFNKKYSIYLLDLLSESRTFFIEKYLILFFQKNIIKNALNVFCVEGLGTYYLKEVNRKYVILNHCLSDRVNIINKEYKKNTIAFAGQIHGTSLDALQILIEALRLKTRNISLKIFSNIDSSLIENYNLKDSFISFHFAKDYNQLIRELSQVEILYSPVAFNAPYQDQASTCFPTKTFDYILAGRPIFVHAPKHFYYTEYMRKYESACISNSTDPKYLMKEIENFMNDNSFQNKVKNNAENLLKRRHLRSQVQKIMLEKL